MASFADPRLRRRLAALDAAARDKIKHRQYVRDKSDAEASIAAALTRLRANGVAIEPRDIFAMRRYGGAAQALARLGDTPELRRADAAFIAADPELAALKAESTAHRAEWIARYANGGPPPPLGAAPMAWHAWSLAQGEGAGDDSPAANAAM